MKYQIILNLLDNTSNQLNKFRTELIGLEETIMHVERITLIVKSNLKLQC